MPSPVWFGLNLFRLTAVVFMAWAFVAQFISLADEVNTLASKTSTRNNFSSPTAIPAEGTAGPVITRWDVAGEMTVGGLGTPAMAAAVTPAVPLPTLITRPALPPTTTTSAFNALQSLPRPNQNPDTPKALQPLVGAGGANQERGYRRRRRWSQSMDEREGEAASLISADDAARTMQIAVLQQEVRPDLVAWVVISRLFIGILLAIGIGAQIGVPEVFLHDHASWLGPQSTPLSLGGLQTFCSIEILRSEGKEINLIPGYALLGIGLLNIVIGLILLYLGRNLPKHPAPPLYFNHAQRLLFWTLEPPFYAQLSDPSLPTHTGVPAMGDPPRRGRKGRLPRSNAHEIGLDDTDSDDEVEKHVEAGGEAPRYVNGARGMTAEEDVTRGGYPTFAAGSGIDQPGRHVPAGTLEQDRWGAPVRFTREDEAAAPVRKSKRADHPPRIELPQRQRSRESTFDDIQADLAGSPRPPHTLPRPSLTKAAQKPIKQRSVTLPTDPPPDALYRAASSASDNSAYSGISRPNSSYRQSIDQAARTLGPHFPLPPTRSSQSHKKASGPAVRADRPDQLKSVSKDGRRPPSAYLARPPLSPAKIVPSSGPTPVRRSPLDVPGPTQAVSKPTKTPSAPKTPQTPKSPLSTPSPVSAHIVEAQHGLVSAGQIVDRQLSASPELISEDQPRGAKPPGQAVARGRARAVSIGTPSAAAPRPAQSSIKRASSVQPGRPLRGVRFDLSSVQEESEVESPAPTPRTGLRIPGTNIHLAFPAILSPVSAKKPHSADEVSPAIVDEKPLRARPVSASSLTSMMEKLEQDMGGDARKAAYRHSSAVLGGGYLEGRKEVLK